VESRLYKNCPFKVITESINYQPGLRVNIKIISDTRYKLTINGNYKVEKELNFGERFYEAGFDFTIKVRDPSHFKVNPGISNKYYLHVVRLKFC